MCYTNYLLKIGNNVDYKRIYGGIKWVVYFKTDWTKADIQSLKF
jgi:hypothetical protein